MSELSNIYDRLGTVERAVAVIQTTLDNLASREYVKDAMAPLQKSMQELSTSQKTLAERTEDLYAAHEKFLTDEAERKKAEHDAKLAALEKQTFSAILGNWAKIGGYVSAIIGAIIVAGPPIVAWFQAVTHAAK